MKVDLHWLTNDGNDIRIQGSFDQLPRVGELVDLSLLASEVEQYQASEAKYLEALRVLAVTHSAAPPGLAATPTVTLERDAESSHLLELEAKDELVESLRTSIKRLLEVLNDIALTGTYGLAAREDRDGPTAPDTLLVFISKFSEVAPAPLERADVVYVPLAEHHAAQKRWKCVKHRYREYPFETSYTGI